MNYKIKFSGACAGALFAALIWLAFTMGESATSLAITLTVMILATTLGWLAGIILTPYTEKEAIQFSSAAKAVSVFLSGYLAAKLDKLVNVLFDPVFVLEWPHGFRIIAGISAFALAMTATFVFRQYAD